MTLLEAAQQLADKLQEAHSKCDISQDEDCYAEQYGDGNAEEHDDFRAAEAVIAAAEGRTDLTSGA